MNDEYATKEDVQDAKNETKLRIQLFGTMVFGGVILAISAAAEYGGSGVDSLLFWCLAAFYIFYASSLLGGRFNRYWNATFGRVDALNVSETLEDYNDE